MRGGSPKKKHTHTHTQRRQTAGQRLSTHVRVRGSCYYCVLLLLCSLTTGTVNGSQHTSEFVGAKELPVNGLQHIKGGGGGGEGGRGDDDRMNFENATILEQQVMGRGGLSSLSHTATYPGMMARGGGAGGGSWVPQSTVLRSGDVPGGQVPRDRGVEAAHHPLSSWEQKVISETRRRDRERQENRRMHSPREAVAVAGLGGAGWEGGHGEYGEHGEYGGAEEAGAGNFELQNRIVNLTDKVSPIRLKYAIIRAIMRL